MPLYEYFCEACQIKFDALKSIAERETAQCPKCGQPANKLISVVNHTFGFRLTEQSHLRFGPRDEYEKDV